jgi:hypothetical protein
MHALPLFTFVETNTEQFKSLKCKRKLSDKYDQNRNVHSQEAYNELDYSTYFVLKEIKQIYKAESNGEKSVQCD